MKIVVMGTGDFAVPTFQHLIAAGHQIPALFTMPIRTRRKDRCALPWIRRVAEENQIPICDPENVNSEEGIALLKKIDADLIFICDYGKILSPEVIKLFPLGCVNLHGSLLPKYRGAAPVHRAILAGETTLGVSLIHLVPQVDAGPVIAMTSYKPDESQAAPEIESYLARLGAPLMIEALEKMSRGEGKAIPQDPSLATPAPKIRKEEGRVRWSQSVRQIRNQYRAFQPWPKTFSDWRRAGEEKVTRLIVGPLEIAKVFSENENSRPEYAVPCGTVLVTDRQLGVLVRAGDGLVRITGFQPAGKKGMETGPFLSGYRMKAGDFLS